MTKEQIEARLAELKDIKIHPRDRTENRLLIARGERLYEESLGDRREMIARLIQQFEMQLQTQNEQVVKQAAEALKEQLDQLERWMDLT